MSHADADQGGRADSVDEWRVDVGEPSNRVPDPDESVGDWSQAEVTQRRERVSSDLESWREQLAERMRRLEQRLDRASG